MAVQPSFPSQHWGWVTSWGVMLKFAVTILMEIWSPEWYGRDTAVAWITCAPLSTHSWGRRSIRSSGLPYTLTNASWYPREPWPHFLPSVGWRNNTYREDLIGGITSVTNELPSKERRNEYMICRRKRRKYNIFLHSFSKQQILDTKFYGWLHSCLFTFQRFIPSDNKVPKRYCKGIIFWFLH